jgi:hypothetical protein
LKYSNRGEPLEAKDEVKVIMFDVLPGLSKHITEMKLAMDPTPGKYNSSFPLMDQHNQRALVCYP